MRLIKLLLLLQLIGSAAAPVAVAAVPAGQADALRARAVSQGELRVIVQLDSFSQPIGAMAPSARLARKQQIAGLQSSVLAQLRLPGLRELARFENIPFILLAADSRAIEALARLPQVIGIQEDIPEGPNLASSLPVIGAASVWAQGFDGSGITVVVMDTGVDTSHSFFPPPKLKAEACFSTNSVADNSRSLCPGAASSSTAPGSGQNCPANVNGCTHGTHVAGIAVGHDGVGPNTGVAKGAGLISIQVFSCVSSSANCTGVRNALSYPSDQVRAMEHVLTLSQNIDIAAINLSLGGAPYTDATVCDADNAARKAAIDNLRSVGIATIVAAGNNSRRDAVSQPGCISTAISVGNSTDADSIASTSNVANFLDLLAPGDSITSSAPGGGLFTMSGTSMAAPHVAGAFAILRQAVPAASIDEILSALSLTGTSVDDQRSNGVVNDMRRINLDPALALLIQPQPEISTVPAAGNDLDLGDATVGGSGAELDLLVNNIGDASLSLACQIIGAQAVNFAVTQCPASIAAAGSGTVKLRCDPQEGGGLEAELRINSNDASEPQISFGLNCTGLGAEIFSLPASGSELNLGSVLIQTIGTVSPISISNMGTESLSLACNLAGAAPGEFVISACPAAVAALAQAQVGIQCQPHSSGPKSAVLEIASNDANEGLLSFNLVCTGLAPELDTNPADGAELEFGHVRINTSGTGQFINLHNNGDGLLLPDCGLSGADPDSFDIINCPPSLAPDQQYQLEIRCHPLALGELLAELQISSNDEDEGLLEFSLTCIGVAPEFNVDPVASSLLDFGSVYVTESSVPAELLISNSGGADLHIACTLQGTHSASFQILQCPATVPASQSVVVQLQCNPASSGSKLAQLRISTDDVDEAEAVFDLACQAQPPVGTIFEDSFEQK